MRIMIPLLFAALLSLICISCEYEEVDMGLPASITFPKEGGEYVLPLYYPSYASISELSGEKECKNTHDSIDGYDIIKYKWLTVKLSDQYQDGQKHRITIIADRSDSGKPRELMIRVLSDPYYCYLKVRQEQ